MKVTEIKDTGEHSKAFQLSQIISQTEKVYSDSTEAMQSPIASKIFGFPWTAQIKVAPEFVEITKQDWVEWVVLEEPLKGLIEEHFKGAQEPIEENPELKPAAHKGLETPEAQQIIQLLEHQINPALASHGGYVTLHGVENNQVYLEMGGGCQGCAMSYQTMKEGIETAIKEHVPNITQVVDVTNHAQGENPFY
jgi:Fe-S cluster biogenesis protein NfuA